MIIATRPPIARPATRRLRRLPRRSLLGAGGAILAWASVGCARSGTVDDDTPARPDPDDGAFPITIASALGPVTIAEPPRRVVCIGWSSHDAALALGVKPIAQQDLSGDGGRAGILPWDDAPLQGHRPVLIKADTQELPFEQIAGLAPDLILAVQSGVDADQYRTLSGIAPSLAYPGKPWLTSWQDQVALVGQALGLRTKAAQVAGETTKLIEDTARDHPEFSGRTAVFGSGTQPGSYNFYTADDTRVDLLTGFGFRPSPSVAAMKPTAGANAFARTVSLERLPQVSGDVLVAWYLDPGTQRAIEASALFRSMPAVKRGGYVAITDPVMVFATSAVNVLSLPWMIKTYTEMLSDAARGRA